MAQVWRKIILSLIVAGLAGIASSFWSRTYWLDINPPLCSARHLLAGLEPYSGCATDYGGVPASQYPMTTIIAFVPFALLPGSLASAAIWGAVNGLLTYGILSDAKLWRFLVFASGPYALAFVFHQISPLVAAVILLPSLLPLALLKPQVGLPVILTNLTTRRALACLIFVLVTFIVYPSWPIAWYASARSFDGLIPLLVVPLGPLLALALLRWRKKNALTLFLFACIPQRSIYDLVPLMILAQTKAQMIIICTLSWLPVVGLLYGLPWRLDPHLAIAFIYLPLLVMQFLPCAPTRAWPRWLPGARARPAG